MGEWILFLLIGGTVVLFVTREYLRQRRYDRSPEFTAQATLVDRHQKGGSSAFHGYAAYYGVFETAQGEVLELKMYREQYYNLPEKAEGILTWQGEDLLGFEEVGK